MELTGLVRRSSSLSTGIWSRARPFKEIPGPRSLPLVGSLLNYVPPFGKYNMDRIHHVGLLKYKEYGKMIREEVIPGSTYLFLFDPVDFETMFRIEGRYPSRRSHTILEKVRTVDTAQDHNSAGLLPTNGEEWSKMRTGFQQALAFDNVRTLLPKSDQIVMEFADRVNDPSMESADLLPALMLLSLDLVGQNFFGARIGKAVHEDIDMVPEAIVKAAELVNEITLKTDSGLRLWRWIDTPLYKEVKQNILALEKIARFFVNHHIEKKGGAGAFENPCILELWLKEGNSDLKDIVTMSADMLLAGIDTTSFTSSFILYHLGTNEEAQDKLFQELQSLLPSLKSPITSEVLGRATYLKRCIKESLRMSPISVGVSRIVPEDSVIGGYQVPPNTIAVTMNQVACRFPEHFDRPDEYLPDRWAPENKRTGKIHPYLLLPFGHGARACIGRRLAEQSLQLIVARLIRRYHLEWIGPGPLDSITVNINRPDSPLRFNFMERD